MRSIRSLSCVLLLVGVLLSACTKQRKPGEACRAGPSDAICADATSLGSCRGFTWHVDPCRGPGGCASGVCDQSVAVVDDACGADGAEPCSTDGTQVLRCTGGRMVAVNTCRGERGCYRAAPNAPPSCDPGPPKVGDACTPTNGSLCSADGKEILQCSQQTHHMVVERDCLGPKGCFIHPVFRSPVQEWLGCDASTGDVGQPCVAYDRIGTRGLTNGGGFCSTDGKQLLTCQSGMLVADVQCPCDVVWDHNQMAFTLGCTDRDHQWRAAVGLSMLEKR